VLIGASRVRRLKHMLDRLERMKHFGGGHCRQHAHALSFGVRTRYVYHRRHALHYHHLPLQIVESQLSFAQLDDQLV